jgi:hypothetical protein
MTGWVIGLLLVAVEAPRAAAPAVPPTPMLTVHPSDFRKVDKLSGDQDYYSLQTAELPAFLRAQYRPPMKTVVYGYEVPEAQGHATQLSWNWRVIQHPHGADERVGGKRDSAASVYCFFKIGLVTYTLKYVFSKDVPTGTRFRKDHTWFDAMGVIVLATYRPEDVGEWRTETVNFAADFRQTFGRDKVPRLRGIGVMSDGDNTKSEVIADYGDFELWR